MTSELPDPPAVKWPGDAAYAADGGDVGEPIRSLLQGLRLLETPAQEREGVKLTQGTPVSLQVLTSGATSIAKWWTGLIATIGGGGTVLAAIDNWQADPANDTARSVAILGVALLGSAVVLSIALIVRADVSGRAAATTAEYAARAQVAEAMLDNMQYGRPAPAAPPPRSYYWAQTDYGWFPVTDFAWRNGALVAVLDDGRGDAGGGTVATPADLRSLMPYPPNAGTGSSRAG